MRNVSRQSPASMYGVANTYLLKARSVIALSRSSFLRKYQ
ncbi:Uncharacterised protein [Mycobacterium tuberculosis]|nr:Uncharacterised protein [Mycobacterium tuberculosis]